MEMIIKINSNHLDAEVLFHDFLDDSVFEKKISIEKLRAILNEYDSSNEQIEKKKTKFLDQRIIGLIDESGYKKYLINEPAHKRVVTYDYQDVSGGIRINFPAAIYEITVVKKEIKTITAFMYFEYKGLDTILYKYGMPNMLSENEFCIGRAKREIDIDIFQTLENIIYSPYSHAQLSNVKGFNTTEDYFIYLENNQIQEKYLYSANLQLKDIVEII